MIPGSNSTVTIEHLVQTRDAHGANTDGAADETYADVDAMIGRASLGNLWRLTVDGNFQRIGEGPAEWRITDNLGNVYAPVKATHRPPITQLGESEHTLIFAELHGEIESEARI